VAEINQVPPVLGYLSHCSGVTASQLPYLITHNLYRMKSQWYHPSTNSCKLPNNTGNINTSQDGTAALPRQDEVNYLAMQLPKIKQYW